MPRLTGLVVWFIVTGALSAQEAHRYSGPDTLLARRWTWAVEEGARTGADSFWIGYSIRRLMDDDSYIVSGSVVSGTKGTRTSLYEILGLHTPTGTGDRDGSRMNEGTNVFKRMKDVALLFLLSGTRSGEPNIIGVKLCNMELSVDLKKHPVLWLGATDDDQSVRHLTNLYKSIREDSEKRRLVEAVGIHQRSAEVYPFLSDVLKSRDADDVRAQAAFWVSQQHNPDALSFLMDIAQHDPSAKVREQAVFAVSQTDGDASTDALITLVRKGDNAKVRGKAAFWLGQKASQKAVSTLEDIVSSDEETEVQRQALYGLAQIKSREGIDRLIKIAENHPNPRIRRQAIQILGQSDDPKALDALIDIARK
ncbi:MAG TPA: HEAT repeat domain-containing protein [Bacteroidota bacterium]|nr:HEAT repeat domain-containing protein [Bacteroidota bacterium]